MRHHEPAAADTRARSMPGPSPTAGAERSRDDAAVATWLSAGRRVQARLSTAALRIRRRWRSAAFRAARLTGAAVESRACTLRLAERHVATAASFRVGTVPAVGDGTGADRARAPAAAGSWWCTASPLDCF